MTTPLIPTGGFTVARQLFQSAIWLRDPLDLKIWVWILGKANHSGIVKNGYQYNRGEFVTTYDEIINAGLYIQNRKRIFPTMKKVRVVLKWLQDENMILVKPLKSGHGITGADSGAETRAYVGLKIIVVNYDTYQDSKSYRGRHQGRDISAQGHNSNNDIYNIVEIPFSTIIDHLNEKAGKHYRASTPKTESLIKARWNEGNREKDFFHVIDVKASQWLNTPQERYLRPETLFGTKFEAYRNEKPLNQSQPSTPEWF
jgi:uncharacterized phage protein (TIGR02220 family)